MGRSMIQISDEWLRLSDRREFLGRHVPQCPACHRNQVQLLNHGVPAQWKCRVCRVCFEFEPSS
jgi:ribosomal protein L37AE/L43A